EAKPEMSYAVPYEESWYKRSDHFTDGEEKGREVRVLQSGTTYYFVDATDVPSTGKRAFSDGQVSITREDGSAELFPAVKLTRGEAYEFFKPEFRSMFLLVISYVGLLLIGALLAYWQRFLLQVSANKIVRKMRND